MECIRAFRLISFLISVFLFLLSVDEASGST